MPQQNFARILFRFHFRYQPVQEGVDSIEVALEEPQVFIDCRAMGLHEFQRYKNHPLINLLGEHNRPQKLTAKITNGRVEDRPGVLGATFGLTIVGAIFMLNTILDKFDKTTQIRVAL